MLWSSQLARRGRALSPKRTTALRPDGQARRVVLKYEKHPPSQEHREAEARRNLGMDHLAKGRTALAIRELTHAESLNTTDSDTQLWLGESYRRKGRLKEAQRYAERAVRLDPENHDARLNLSGLYLQMGRF